MRPRPGDRQPSRRDRPASPLLSRGPRANSVLLPLTGRGDRIWAPRVRGAGFARITQTLIRRIPDPASRSPRSEMRARTALGWALSGALREALYGAIASERAAFSPCRQNARCWSRRARVERRAMRGARVCICTRTGTRVLVPAGGSEITVCDCPALTGGGGQPEAYFGRRSGSRDRCFGRKGRASKGRCQRFPAPPWPQIPATG